MNKQCAICDFDLNEVIRFENFPSGAIFIPVSEFSDFSIGEDLILSRCTNCSHLQLMNEYKQNTYDESYSYRSVHRPGNLNKAIAEELIINLNRQFGVNSPRSVLEIGANDLSFIKSLETIDKKIAVDPILSEWTTDVEGVTAYPTYIERIPSELYDEVDLVISRHNLEHLPDPGYVLRQIKASAEKTRQEKYMFVEAPDLDRLLTNNRIDQIFLDHIHYFDTNSLSNLFSRNGFLCLKVWKNSRYGGSICGLFVARPGGETSSFFRSSSDIDKRLTNAIDIFSKKCGSIRNLLEENYGNVYGFGAGHSTPFLAYHLDGRLHLLEGIIDDDPGKLNKKIKGLVPPIVSKNALKHGYKILITATDHTADIIGRLKPNIDVLGLLVEGGVAS